MSDFLCKALNFLDFQAARWLNDGDVPAQEGNEHPTITSMGTYAASDGLVNVAGIGSWKRFCATLDAPSLTDDPRFATNAERLRHRPELRTELEAILAKATVSGWVDRLNDACFPAGPVLRVDETFSDPQVVASGRSAPSWND